MKRLSTFTLLVLCLLSVVCIGVGALVAKHAWRREARPQMVRSARGTESGNPHESKASVANGSRRRPSPAAPLAPAAEAPAVTEPGVRPPMPPEAVRLRSASAVIRRTGPPSSALISKGREFADALTTELPAELTARVELGRVECFLSGCVFDVAFKDSAAKVDLATSLMSMV